MINAAQLKAIIPRIPQSRVDVYLEPLNQAMEEFQVNTRRRRAAFIAQVAHESGGLKYMEEIWGPSAAQKRYEGRKDLGNTKPGDGKRFKGRGPIQITGRANYERYGALLGLPLAEQPNLAAMPGVGFRIAGAYWKSHGLNRLADVGEFGEITKRINGGYNGLADRKKYYERALDVLSDEITHEKVETADEDAESKAVVSTAESTESEPGTGVEAAAELDKPKPGEPVAETPATTGEAIVGGRPGDPQKQVTTGGFISRLGTAVGSLTGIGAAVGGFMTGKAGIIIVGIICATLLILILIFRQLILDYVRLHLGAAPDKYNVR